MSRWRPTVLLAVLAASSPNAWGASATLSGPTLFTNTEYVEALAVSGQSLWAATRGGVEEYDLRSLKRTRLLTTNDGVPTNAVRGVEIHDGTLVAITTEHRCLFEKQRFECTPALHAPQTPAAPELWQGARITASLTVEGRRFIGTADRGVWLVTGQPQRLTPTGQMCGNHVMAIAEFAGSTWFGTFDEGLCTFDGQVFTTVAAPFHMVNDLVATPHGLFVATNSGLFRSDDGKSFQAMDLLGTRSLNDLAFDGDTLWATNPAVLWQIPLDGGKPRGYWQPGGTHSLQAVDVVNGRVWLASEDRGLLRKRGRKFEIFDRAAGLPSSWVVDVAALADGGAIAATLRDGLVRLSAKGRVTPLPNAPDAWLLHVTRDDKALWVGTQAGAAHFQDRKVELLAHLPNPCVHVILRVESGVWAGTEGGLAFYAQS